MLRSSLALRNAIRSTFALSSSSSSAAASRAARIFSGLDSFPRRHIGPSQKDLPLMLSKVGSSSFDDFASNTIPNNIRLKIPTTIGPGQTESQVLETLKQILSKNKVKKSFIGMGYTNTIVPPVILRNIFENPGWYTQYTPYQPEISQGRLESLINYQTMITDLTGMDIANASLLDEGTAAAEAMFLTYVHANRKKNLFFVDENCHPQTIACIQMRAEAFGINVKVGSYESFDIEANKTNLMGALIQYPNTRGTVIDYQSFISKIHAAKGLVAVAADILSLTILKSPGELGADIALGNTQRFGVPLGFGGPHAAYFAVKDELKRKMPGRLVGLSKDSNGDPAYRLSLQTREQHIRREKATSNICTAQALLANMAAMYTVYHGPEGIKNIAQRVHNLTAILAEGVERTGGFKVLNKGSFFDTIALECTVTGGAALNVKSDKLNLRTLDSGKTITITLDETTTKKDILDILHVLNKGVFNLNASKTTKPLTESDLESIVTDLDITENNPAFFYPKELKRKSKYLTHPTFNLYHSETEMLRYITHLQSKDLSLANAMIPLGSCTMKLNATTEMIPVTWSNISDIHPFAPEEDWQGYKEMISGLNDDLSSLTGYDRISFQPNSGAQGEYAGLRVIRAYLESKGEGHRNICLIPVSAHGTNPASSAMAGLEVIPVKCEDNKHGNLDLKDLKAKAEKYKDNLAAIMITYPSTYGVFEDTVRSACEIVHANGGQVYLDGANLNAMIGLCKPGEIGADVGHLNLHKTFCIPHGGGGPGVGPIGVKSHLIPFLPGHPHSTSNLPTSIGPISAAEYGSASILPISWSYLKMMGDEGIKRATLFALLNANYMRKRLEGAYPILYVNENGHCAHEFIVDCRHFAKISGIEAIDIAKRLQDYGFHSPTMSFPVANTLMIEPTESESLAELDRFCDAMLNIREEIREIEEGKQPKDNNVLVNAPHSIKSLLTEKWDKPYSREKAAYPVPNLKHRKFWPTVSRIDDVFGDRNLICSCPPMEDYVEN